VAEWSIALDCKSGAFGLRRFESFPAHQYMESLEKEIENKFSEEKYQELRSYWTDISEKTEQLSNEDFDSLHDKKDKKVEDLRSKYSDPQNYATWHILGGSSVVPSMTYVVFNDFPKPDSVEDFLDELKAEYFEESSV
jgi:hypothetical protein